MKKTIIFINNKHIKIVSLLLTVILLSSCESFIEVDHPDSQLTDNIVFNDLGSAEAAITNIYSKLSNNVLVCGNLNGISILLGSYADELQTYNTGISEFQFFQNSLVATNTNVASLWNGSYNLIYATNAIKEGLENSTALSQNNKNRLIGEVLFLRAYIHFHLLNLFGEIPYVATTNYVANSSIEKLPVSQIYTLLIADLEKAKSLVPTTQSPFKVRAGIDAVKSLLARVHLYNTDWELAEAEASSVINSGNFIWVESLDDVFLKNSTGTIWQLMPTKDGLPTQEGQSFIFKMGPPNNRALNTHLVDAFEHGDLRKEHWIGSVKGNAGIWYYPFKYKQNTTETTSTEYSILFRLEELYLIRAEARTHLRDFDGARNDLNKIRNRALLANTSAETGLQLIDAIIQERRIEFFSELGHRFFDLKRAGIINSALSPIKLGWDSTDSLLPIPESETLLNPNLLPQNPGY
ncbi:MAG TPA: RagB/SusD family nutrient uptake outer membrane protein [Gelidibacter sp.]|uniref:RagB/SusD family nutrient uptake outer membrane protein n=1 Tax=Gelidibacter sp. TaxID=2018083 RepID=UPI002BDD995C|nr:RagB/SusD family nutrient uptake outer membrane protein [Gelidibacter sp.]HXK00004.1 RagB/SusD family nutrient uptake outer membrane protein [Gelidibacter sp.]